MSDELCSRSRKVKLRQNYKLACVLTEGRPVKTRLQAIKKCYPSACQLPPHSPNVQYSTKPTMHSEKWCRVVHMRKEIRRQKMPWNTRPTTEFKSVVLTNAQRAKEATDKLRETRNVTYEQRRILRHRNGTRERNTVFNAHDSVWGDTKFRNSGQD